MVSQITGFAVQPNKAVVGANAFAHASGIHQDGILKARETYEIMRAEDVGWTANKIVLGKLSGRIAFKARLGELGIALESEADINAAFARFKELADRKSEIFDEDIMALVSDEGARERGRALSLRVAVAALGNGRAAKSRKWCSRSTAKSTRAKPMAMARSTPPSTRSKSRPPAAPNWCCFRSTAISTGTQSQGEVTMRLSRSGRIVNGVGADPDIIVASAKAYLSALNKLHSKLERVNPQQ